MNLRILIFLSVFLITDYAFAQVGTLSNKRYKRFLFAISGGFSVPASGKTGSYQLLTSVNNPYGIPDNIVGTPKGGFNGKAEAMFLLCNYIGITCSYYYTKNRLDSINKANLLGDD